MAFGHGTASFTSEKNLRLFSRFYPIPTAVGFQNYVVLIFKIEWKCLKWRKMW